MENKKEKALVKQDINFLEYPNWALSRWGGRKEIVIKKEKGLYKFRTANDRLPDRVDKTILYYLIRSLGEKNFNRRKIKTTRYRMTEDIFGGRSQYGYKRVIEGLERWTDVSVSFEGIFYKGDGYTTRIFHIIDNVKLNKKTGELTINLDDYYLEWLKASQYYRMIDYKEFRKFKKDISARLYEIFKAQPLPWKIEARNLAEKLTLGQKYPSYIVRKVEQGIKELNKKTDLKIKFSHDKNERKETICVFSLLSEYQAEREKRRQDKTDKAFFEQRRNKIFLALMNIGVDSNIATGLFRDFPLDRMEKQIKYFPFRKATENPAGLIVKAIRENWGMPTAYERKREEEMMRR